MEIDATMTEISAGVDALSVNLTSQTANQINLDRAAEEILANVAPRLDCAPLDQQSNCLPRLDELQEASPGTTRINISFEGTVAQETGKVWSSLLLTFYVDLSTPIEEEEQEIIARALKEEIIEIMERRVQEGRGDGGT